MIVYKISKVPFDTYPTKENCMCICRHWYMCCHSNMTILKLLLLHEAEACMMT